MVVTGTGGLGCGGVGGDGGTCYFVGCAEESVLCGGGVVQCVLFEWEAGQERAGRDIQGCEVLMRRLIRGVYAISPPSLLFTAMFYRRVFGCRAQPSQSPEV